MRSRVCPAVPDNFEAARTIGRVAGLASHFVKLREILG
jgi:hypothetical protein